MKSTSIKWPCTAAVTAGLCAVLTLPPLLEVYSLINATIYVSMAVFALSMAFVWGYGGILCFGQAAFFGLGAYSYAVSGINFGDSSAGLPAALLVPAGFAAVLGWFVFYGRLTDVYFGVITLTTTLILSKLANSSAGEAYRVGKARLGGFNGMPDTPPLNLPFDPTQPLTPAQTFSVCVAALVTCYVGVKWLLSTPYGRAVVAVRENEVRAELLGHDARFIKLTVFVIGAAIAGLAGMLFASTVFVSPTVFGLATAAQVLIWVVVGGLGTLVGPVLACVLLQALSAVLGKLGFIDPSMMLGLVLIGAVLLVPRGLLPPALDTLTRVRGWRPARAAAAMNEAAHHD